LFGTDFCIVSKGINNNAKPEPVVKMTSDERDDLAKPEKNLLLAAGCKKSSAKDQSDERVKKNKFSPTIAEKKAQSNLLKSLTKPKDYWDDLADDFDFSTQEFAVQ
jgi:hypothetical protein